MLLLLSLHYDEGAVDTIASLLETKLEEAEKALATEVHALLSSREKVLTLRNDVIHLRGSLEALTRNNGHRYVATPVTTEADGLLGLQNRAENRVESAQKSPTKKLTSPVSKVSEVLRAIRENPGLKSRELYNRIEASGTYAFKITMEDIHRTTFRLSSREHIRRDEMGRLWPVPEKS